MTPRPPSAQTLRAAGWLACAAVALGGCTEEPVALPLRSLDSAGPVTFVCLGEPSAEPADWANRLDVCTGLRTLEPDDYVIPHLYALVTQPVRGEVAVVDLTTESGAVLDQDPLVPGANFLPVGGRPTDIVATPGGMASFVTVAEPGFEGLYALPSPLIRGSSPRLTTWPSCSLPAVPEMIEIAIDPPDAEGLLRPSCDAAYGEPDQTTCGPEGVVHCHGDLSEESGITGKSGRYKLIVTLPDEGGFAVIDAQELLDREPGEFAPCAIERWVPLQVLASSPPPPPQPAENACVNEDFGTTDPFADAYVPQPAGLALTDDRMYVADLGAPVIHVVDLPTPCEPIERPGLVPRSVEEPSRVVLTNRVAVSPQTLDFKRYLYAIDYYDGSTMVFDVSDDSITNVPLERSFPELNPFQPPDRIRFQTPPRDVVTIQHLNDDSDPNSGANVPCRCDPEPGADTCGVRYRTNENFDRGAGPYRLRGIFSFIVLASGDIVTIDVDDYDAPCRGPKQPHPLYGCADTSDEPLGTSGEYSCRTVVPHQTRAGSFLLKAEDVADKQPGLEAFPVVFDPEGSALTEGPKMRATVPTDPPATFNLIVGTKVYDLDPQTGQVWAGVDRVDPEENTLAMNLEDPRAHIIDQGWSVTYEGALPGFSNRFAQLSASAAETFELRESNARFCDRGVLGEVAMREILEAQGVDPDYVPGDAKADLGAFGDYIQIISSTPVESDAYWDAQAECTFNSCRAEFGTLDQPKQPRDLRIVEAYNDRVELRRWGAPDADAPRLKCCFPGVVEFAVRPAMTWTVVGNTVGFLHHVIPDPATGACRNSCDPLLGRKNGRVLVRVLPVDPPPGVGEEVADGDPFAFINPFFRFVVTGPQPTWNDRDTRFEFVTKGAFSPLALTVVTSDGDVQPQSIQYLGPTGELVLSDGSLEGITFLNLNALVVTRKYN